MLFDNNFELPEEKPGMRFEPTIHDLQILKHQDYNGFDESAPELCCWECKSSIAYYPDDIDPLLSYFCCMGCHKDFKEQELMSLTNSQIAQKFFWLVPRDTDSIYVLESINSGTNSHFITRLMKEDEEESYYLKVLESYINKFK